MTKILTGKRILVAEDEVIFRSILVNYLQRLGGNIQQAENGAIALEMIKQSPFDLLLCDISMPVMGGMELISKLQSLDYKIPIVMVSATENMGDVASAMRFGAHDVLLKPIIDFNQLKETVLACLYPTTFSSTAIEKTDFMQDWLKLRNDPLQAIQLLKQLQPPLQQIIAQCKVNYRLLAQGEKVGLVLDIAALSDQEVFFYCLDINNTGTDGVLAALLLRTLFNHVLKEQLVTQHQRLPKMGMILKKINLLLRQANLTGPFPLLAGYYHRQRHHLLLTSAGLSATLMIDKHSTSIKSNSAPLGVINSSLHLQQFSHHGENWQCRVSGERESLQLMLTTNRQAA